MSDGEDRDLLRAWRGEAREAPGELLDRRILKAAHIQHQRRRALPLIAAAMAVCLALALYGQRPQPTAMPNAPLDTSTFGLYEGRGYLQATQVTIRQQPGGFGAGGIVSP